MKTRPFAWLVAAAFASTVCAQQVINLPPGSPIPAPGTYPPGTTVMMGGVVIQAGVGSRATVGTPDATPQEIRSGFPGRSSGFGAAPQLNMRIQGDGVLLPRGVGESAKDKAGTGKEQARDNDRESAQEKAKGEDPGDSKGKDVASTSPRNEKSQSVQEKAKGDDAGGSKGPGIAGTAPGLEKGQPADGKDGSAKDPAQDEGKDRGPATPRPIERESLPPKAKDGRPAISAPRDEKEQDPVARRIDQGLERNPGAARPTDLKVKGSGVEVPRCFGESREGENC